jgi:hypothetical protein
MSHTLGRQTIGTGFPAGLERRRNSRTPFRVFVAAVVLGLWATGCSEAGLPTAPTTVATTPDATATPPTAATPAPPATPPATPPPGLIGRVASGGYVLFFRHAARDTGAISTGDLAIADNAGQCLPGSELTSGGASDAGRIGEAFKRYGIGVDRVYASPACRAIQMARLMFGSEPDARRELTWPGMWTAEERTTLTPRLRGLLGTQPAAGTNVVLLSHNDVLTGDRVGATVTLGQGDAAVFRPLANGDFELIGPIPLQEWLQ